MYKIQNTIIRIAAVWLLTSAAAAATFDFKDPKGVNNIAFSMDAPLEYISGTANGISGTVVFDPANVGLTKGTIVLHTSTLMVANSVMRDHMMGANWMDVTQHPTITFKAHRLRDVTGSDGRFKGIAVGEFTVKGITRDVEIPVSLTYLPGRLGERNTGMTGDILVIRADFSISRRDYGINAGNAEDKVSDAVELKLSIAGFHAK